MKGFILFLISLIVLSSCATSYTISTASRGDICDITVYENNVPLHYTNVVFLDRDDNFIYFCDRDGYRYYRVNRYSTVINLIGYSYSYPYYYHRYPYHYRYHRPYPSRPAPPKVKHNPRPQPAPGHGPQTRPSKPRPSQLAHTPSARPQSRPSQPAARPSSSSRSTSASSRSSNSSAGRRR